MKSRRPTGELESSVLQYVWAVGVPVTPAEVHEAVAPELAYTTVMTVLGRLQKKGLLDRERQGRAYAYWAAEGEGAHRAEQMHEQLSSAGDRSAVLSRFVESLTDDEAAELQRLLARQEPSS